MIRAVMDGYNQDDMNILYSAGHRRPRSVVLLTLRILAVAGLILIYYIYHYSLKPWKKILAMLAVVLLVPDAKSLLKYPKSSYLKRYPLAFIKGRVLMSFEDDCFIIAAGPPENDDAGDYFESIDRYEFKLLYNYRDITYAFEDEDNICLFTKDLAYIVKKDSITQGSPQSLSALLKKRLKRKFTVKGGGKV